MKTIATWAGIGLATLSSAFLTSTTLAAEAETTKPAIVLYSGGIDNLKHSPKDRALHDALVLMEQTGLSLPPDTPQIGSEVIDLVVKAMLSRMSFQLSFDDEAIRQGRMEEAVQLQLTVFGNDGISPNGMHNEILKIMRMTDSPPAVEVEGHPGISKIEGDVPVYMGVQDVAGEQAVVLSVNMLPDTRGIMLEDEPKPINPDTMCAGVIDFNQMTTIIHSAIMMSNMDDSSGMGPEQLRDWLTEMGIMGPEAMRIEWDVYVDSSDSLSHMDAWIRNYRQHFGEMITDKPVSREDLQMIPVDSSYMAISKFKIPAMLDWLPSATRTPEGRAVEPTPMDMAMDMLQSVLGINPRTEFLDYMGETMMLYRSDATGGNGIMSMVMLVELSNAEGVTQSIATMRKHLNRLAHKQADGYVRLVNWSDGTCGDVTTLTFPGVPIPIELSMGVCSGYLIMGLSPQAVIAAAQQADAKQSIIDNPQFRDMNGMASVGKVMQISFSDVPGSLAGGYGLANALMAAVSNYTRPRMDASRGVNMVLPTYHALAKNARSNLYTAQMVGNDVRFTGSGDPSFAVQLTAMMNDPLVLLWSASFAAGVVVPAMDTARIRARAHADAGAMQESNPEDGWDKTSGEDDREN